MLDNLQSQAMYRALKAAGGLHSPAGDKATAVRGRIDERVSQIDAIKEAVDTASVDPLTQLPIPIPTEVTDAVSVLLIYKGNLNMTGATFDLLNTAIGTRMSDVTSNMAVMGVAGRIAQNMGEVSGGCGPLGEAFSVLTSTGLSDAIQSLLDLLPLDEIAAIIESALAVVGSMAQALKDQLEAAMEFLANKIASMLGSGDLLSSMISKAEAMWNDLMDTFKRAVETSVLMSVLQNPCLQGIAEAVMPDSAKDVMDSYLS